MFYETLICDKELVVNTCAKEQGSLDVPSIFCETVAAKDNLVVPIIKMSSSGFPSIDQLVKSQIGSGFIRKIKYYENKVTTNRPMLIYEIANYNFCDNFGNQHKRNNIYFVGDVRRMCIYKKCHDPSCVGFRGHDIFVG